MTNWYSSKKSIITLKIGKAIQYIFVPFILVTAGVQSHVMLCMYIDVQRMQATQIYFQSKVAKKTIDILVQNKEFEGSLHVCDVWRGFIFHISHKHPGAFVPYIHIILSKTHQNMYFVNTCTFDFKSIFPDLNSLH